MIRKKKTLIILGAICLILSVFLILIVYKTERDLFFLAVSFFILIISALLILISVFSPILYNATEEIEERKNSSHSKKQK